MAKLPEKLRQRLPTPQVETFHTGHARSWFWRVLPSPLVSLIGVVTAGSITGLALFAGDRWGNGHGYQWSLVAIGIMTVIAAIAAGVKHLRNKRTQTERSAGFEDALRGSAGGWDSSVSDVAEIARLDDLRTKFQEGLKVFHDYGKDLYELPWYVMVGEPGSGKTEAIRHSELRFPAGLQDKLQGVGGTYSMNWWFTNNAVLLDTAGAMLTQPEAAARFAEFLRLLREHRTDFPINGLILTLPVDQLLTNPPHVAEEKARAIAQQLSVVREALDVRFPLYLLITKSDRLPGFREFFDAEGQASFELQMVGWSNPDPVGTPFDPARLGEAIETVANRLHRRALALLDDPVPRVQGQRRMDEVDRIYAFPEVIRSLGPRVQYYLDTIFQTGAWAAKSPFFRGLYFTSALREGSELDQALAQALNVDVQKLPAGGIFTQDKAVFLRDVFLSKIFPERGLVTRLRDIGALLRRRLLLYYGSVLAALLLALLLTLMVRSSLTQQLADEQKAWLPANASWNNGALLSPLVRRSAGRSVPPTWVWIEGGRDKPLEQLDQILDFSSRRLRFAWVFRPLGEWRDFEFRRRAAGLSLFEASVFKPVLDAARERIRWDTAQNAKRSPETEERLAKAYIQLAKLETWTLPNAKSAPSSEKEWQPFFADLLAYVLDQPREKVAAYAEMLASRTMKAYGTSVALTARDWLAEHKEPAKREDEPKFSALHHAASLLFGQTDRALNSQDQQAKNERRRAELLSSFNDAESRTFEWSNARLPHTRAQVQAECMTPMIDAALQSDRLLTESRGGASASLSFAVIGEAARATLDMNKSLNADSILRPFQAQAEQLAGAREAAGDDTGWAGARRRLEKYRQSFEAVSMGDVQLSQRDIIGNLNRRLTEALQAMAAKPATAPSPSNAQPAAPASKEAAICQYLESFGGATLVSSVLSEYRRQLQRDLSTRLKFPLVDDGRSYPRPLDFQADCKKLQEIENDLRDLASRGEPAIGGEEREKLLEIQKRLQPVADIAKILGGFDQAGTLVIRVDGVAPPPAATPPPPPVLTPFARPGGGLFSGQTAEPRPTPLPPSEIKSVEIMVKGTRSYAPLTGQSTSVPYDGFSPVQIVVKRGVSGFSNDETSAYRDDGNWELLRRAAKQGKSRFVVARGVGFTLESNPLLPFGRWPKLNDLGLNP